MIATVCPACFFYEERAFSIHPTDKFIYKGKKMDGSHE